MNLIRLGPKPPLLVAPGDSVHDLTLKLTERNVAAAAVLDGPDLVGVVTERDIVRHIVVSTRNPHDVTVREIMSSPVVTVDLETTITAAVSLMRARHIRHLVVIDDDGNVVGMLALRHLLYAVMDDLEQNVGDLTNYIMIDSPGG